MTPVGFQLILAGTSGADAAAESRKGFAKACETGHPVLQLRQFYLQFAFRRCCSVCEDVEDQDRPIDDSDTQSVFQISDLRPAEFIIENNRIDIHVLDEFRQFQDFAAPDESRVVRLLQTLLNASGDRDAVGLAKALQFIHGSGDVAFPLQSDDDGVVFFVPYDFVVLVKSDHSDSNMPKGEPSGIVSCLCFVCAC